jgi:NDP-sugar pyrophosphorylase family protein/aminoglycoside/choline kinase family phosphotransferase
MSELPACFILAAGRGERMRPMTSHIPKPLLPIAGKPLLESIVEKALASEFGRIGVNTHHLNSLIECWVKDSGLKDKIRLFHETEILDTGGALKNAETFLETDDFLVHNGDIMSDIDLAALLEHHRASGNFATLAIMDRPDFNNVLIDKNGFLKGIGKARRPDSGEKMVAFTGIAAYSPAFLKVLPPGASGVVEAWLKAISLGFRIGIFDVSGCSWSDIGSPAAYVSAVLRSLRDKGENVHIDCSAAIPEDADIAGNVIIGESASIGSGSSLRNCVVLPNGAVKPGAHYEDSIIGPDYVVGVDETAFGLSVEGKGMLIGSGGSDRKYFRAKEPDRTVVLMECGHDDPDFIRQIEYTVFFRKYGIPVPDLIFVDLGARSAVFEDLGDMSLYSRLKFRRGDDAVEQTYMRVMEIMARLHGPVSDHVSECPALASRVFDYEYLRWETAYFIERFVRGVREIRIKDNAAIDDEFHRLAARTDSFTKRIIHRDFQSQNIMMTKDIPRIIDYQGARMAPPAYDIASVLWDPYAPIKNDIRDRTLNYYLSLLADTTGGWFSSEGFTEALIYCRLQRHMQALGAYGFLAKIKGKTYFLKYAPEAVRLLKEDVEPVRTEFPLLAELIDSL